MYFPGQQGRRDNLTNATTAIISTFTTTITTTKAFTSPSLAHFEYRSRDHHSVLCDLWDYRISGISTQKRNSSSSHNPIDTADLSSRHCSYSTHTLTDADDDSYTGAGNTNHADT